MALLPSNPANPTTDPDPDPETPTTQAEGGHEELVGGGKCHCHLSVGHSGDPSPTAALPLGQRDAEEESEDHAAVAEEKWGGHAGGEEEDGWGAPDSPFSRAQPRSNAARRDPRKAELFRMLDASCEADRLREASLLHPPPPPPSQPETEEPDVPIWPPNTANWRRFRYLRDMESSSANHVVSPTENTLPHQPSEKSQKMISDKDGDQCYDDGHFPESAPNQIAVYENDQGKNYCSPAPSKKRGQTIAAYAVQCKKCSKWRLISCKKNYEEIRERIRQVPFLCEHANEWNPGVTCRDPPDISQDDSRIWAIDKPGIPQPPLGWERIITLRSEGCTKFADVYYIPPEGKTLRSTVDIEKYLAKNPQHAAGVQLSQFSFQIPAPLQRDYVRKRLPLSKPLEPKQVLALSSAPPIHEHLAHTILVPYKEAVSASDMSQDQLQGDDRTSKFWVTGLSASVALTWVNYRL